MSSNGLIEDPEHEDTEEDPWDEMDIDIQELGKILDDPMADLNSHLNTSIECIGFDNNVGNTWIYPSNLPKRSYQQSIAQAALYKNTLVVLPTGLGKTFIAAVVMYNIYRWYPRGKVIFMAPTKPLVTQQIQACQRIMPFPGEDTVEITGRLQKNKRISLWRNKRVFFATPQVVQSDMIDQNGETIQDFPFEQIRLIVVDEAHKAKGRYSYTEVVQRTYHKNRCFRILALSATPGRKVDDVAEVIRNLFISHLEVRWDNSIDVMPYVNHRSIKTIVVSLGDKIKALKEQLVKIIDPYLRQLIDAGVLNSSHQHITKNSLIFEQKNFRERSFHNRHPQQSAVNSNFSICLSLFHSLELLERHGLRVFLNSFEDDEEGKRKFVLSINPSLQAMVNNLRRELGPNPFDISTHAMTNGQLPELPKDLDFGHPKFEQARKILLEHFQKNSKSRAIVFCEYRESVMLIFRLLLQHAPLLRPRCFVGQGGSSGSLRALSQKQQIQIMQDFRSGKSNILIATSIAEEGIDVGEVDLIVCFDISTSNPTRFIQRIGRTGRQKRGSVVMLVTEGKEKQTLQEVLSQKDHMNQKLLKSSVIKAALYTDVPRMVPPNFKPKCLELLVSPPKTAEPDVADEVETKNKAKPNRVGRAKAKKDVAIKNTQDLRKFFQKDKKLEEDFPLPSTGNISQKSSERSMEKVKSLFKNLNMNMLRNTNSQLLRTQADNRDKEQACSVQQVDLTEPPKEPPPVSRPKLEVKTIRRLNKFFKASTDVIPVSERHNLLNQLKSANFSRSGKLLLLKSKWQLVREIYEKMQILQAIEMGNDMTAEEQTVRDTYEAIGEFFKNSQEMEDFLKATSEEEKQKEKERKLRSLHDLDEMIMSEEDFKQAQLKIFKDLDEQGSSWDSFDYRQEELQKIDIYKNFLNRKEENQKVLPIAGNSMAFEPISYDTTNTKFNFDEEYSENITITDSKYASQWEEDFGQSKVPCKSTPLSGPLVQAFQRQKSTEKKAKRRLDSVKEHLLTNEDEDDDVIFVPLSNEDCYKDEISIPKSKLEVEDDESFRSSTASSPVEHSALVGPTEDLLRPPKAIEASFMLRQQSTPIAHHKFNKEQVKPPSETLEKEKSVSSVHEDFDHFDFEAFMEPLPEEIELLTHNVESLSGSSLKENNKPNLAPKNEPPRRTADLFGMLEAKPTNTVLSPQLDKGIFKSPAQSSTNTTPSNLTNRRTSDLFGKLEAQPTNTLLSPLTSKTVFKSPNLSFTNKTPTNFAKTRQVSDFFGKLESKATNTISPQQNKGLLEHPSPNTTILPSPQSKKELLKNPALKVPTPGSPKNRTNTALALKNHETSPSIMSSYTRGVQRLQSMRSSSTLNGNSKVILDEASNRINSPVTEGVQLKSNQNPIPEDVDSPIVRKSKTDGNLKRKILEDTDSDEEIIAGTPKRRKSLFSNKSDFEEILATQEPKRRDFSKRRKDRFRRARLCSFFNHEADVSGNEGHTSEEHGDDDENSLDDFVCDTVIVNDDSKTDSDDAVAGTQMQAIYLQSVKSPQRPQGGFRIFEPRHFDNCLDVYSQAIPEDPSHYVDDSFVVNEEDISRRAAEQSLCPLEQAERILKQRKREAKRRKLAGIDSHSPRRKRLRKCYQLQDESDNSDGIG